MPGEVILENMKAELQTRRCLALTAESRQGSDATTGVCQSFYPSRFTGVRAELAVPVESGSRSLLKRLHTARNVARDRPSPRSLRLQGRTVRGQIPRSASRPPAVQSGSLSHSERHHWKRRE